MDLASISLFGLTAIGTVVYVHYELGGDILAMMF